MAAGAWLDEEVFPAGMEFVGVEAGDFAPEPFADGAEGVVVEGVHAWVLEAAALDEAIPAFPDGGRSLFEHVAPRGDVGAGEEGVDEVWAVGVGQFEEHADGALDAGGRAALVAVEGGDEAFGCWGAEGVREEVEVEGEGISGLGVALDEAVGADEGAVKGGPDLGGEVGVFLGVVGVAEDGGHSGDEGGGLGEESGGEDGWGDGASVLGPAFEFEGIAVEPVVVVIAALVAPDEVWVGAADEVDPVFGGGVVVVEEAAVAVIDVGAPGDEDAGVAPGGGAGEAVVGSEGVGGEVGEAAVVGLGVADIDEPFAEEGFEVAAEGGGLGEDLGVAHPAEAFVALGAVGGDAMEVAAEGPLDGLPEAVEAGVGAGEIADVRGIGMDDAAGEEAAGRRVAEAAHFDVAEAMVGELGFKSFETVPAEGEAVFLGNAAEVVTVKVAIGLEHFGVAQGDGLAGLAAEAEAAPADDVLAEVEHVDVGGRLGDVDGAEFLGDADGFVGLGDEGRGDVGAHCCWAPTLGQGVGGGG